MCYRIACTHACIHACTCQDVQLGSLRVDTNVGQTLTLSIIWVLQTVICILLVVCIDVAVMFDTLQLHVRASLHQLISTSHFILYSWSVSGVLYIICMQWCTYLVQKGIRLHLCSIMFCILLILCHFPGGNCYPHPRLVLFLKNHVSRSDLWHSKRICV